jgi:NADPH:quinone reductase-like Zn-dependent oxidoreductase
MALQMPTSMNAIKINGTTAALTRVPVPDVPQTYLLARVNSVALNPTDWKHIADSMAAPNGTAGTDFAGTVVSLPTGASKTFQVGDRIAATTHGSNFNNPNDGCFADYALVKADLAIKIPDTLSFDKAATLPLGVSTVAQGLFQKGLKLRLPDDQSANGESVLIYGGSTATGSLSIQLAKLAGYNVLTICGKKHESFVRGLGASAVYDYREQDVGELIRRETHNGLKLAWDCIGGPDTLAICAAALSSDDTGCRYSTTNTSLNELPGRPGVTATHVFMYTIFGSAFDKNGVHFPASNEDFEFAHKFFNLTQELLQEDKLRPHPESVQPGGLEGVLQGLKDMKDGKVSGQKLVYRLEDTAKDLTAEVRL